MTLKELYAMIGGDYDQAVRVMKMDKLIDRYVRKLTASGTYEKLAEAGETYIMEGKAPSHELRHVFDKFAKWLKDVYEVLQRSENYAELTDEVREVFDRMLAAEDDIAEMEHTKEQLKEKLSEMGISHATLEFETSESHCCGECK